MYRQESLRCPSCEGGLTKVTSPVEVHGCHACGGLWLGPDATVHVMRGLEDEVDVELAREGRILATGAKKASSIPEDQRVCPVCMQGLSRVNVASIRIDTCFSHGSWFDKAELTDVVDVCASLAASWRREPRDANNLVDTAMPEVFRPLWLAIARLRAGK